MTGEKRKIAVAAGDGIGPEITEATMIVLEEVSRRFGCSFEMIPVLAGGAAIDACGDPLPKESLDACKEAGVVLLGAVGGPRWDDVTPEIRPEKGLLRLRKELGLYANLRPATIYSELSEASPLKNEIIAEGVDILVVRELVGGIYFGERKTYEENGIRAAYDVEKYDEKEVRRIAITAFEAARKRRKVLTSVDKANVLDSSRLWRTVVAEVAADYPDVAVSHMYVDNAAMQLVRNPRQFDVILTNNIFGDILSDEASQITGSIGLLPSASLGEKYAMYEPIHGSAPDIAGKNLANPLGTILSAAMMLRHSFDMETEAEAIESAVKKTLADGIRTADLGGSVGTREAGEQVAKNLKDLRKS